MHQAAFDYVTHAVSSLPPRRLVVEYGGRWINGGVKSLFTAAESYTSIDLLQGENVDIVGDATEYRPETPPDTVVCCEVLEHSERWADLVKAASGILNPDTGVLILTCATRPRIPHSGIDGGPVHEFEYYRNVSPEDLQNVLGSVFEEFEMDVEPALGDMYCTAWKKAPSEETAPSQSLGEKISGLLVRSS